MRHIERWICLKYHIFTLKTPLYEKGGQWPIIFILKIWNTTLLEDTCKQFWLVDFFFTNLVGYFEKSVWGNYNPYMRMVVEFDDFTLIILRVLFNATLSLNKKLISPEITKSIKTKHEQPILTDIPGTHIW